MNDFAARLEEASSALQKLNYQPLEEFPALAVQVARRTALAMIQEMLGHLRSRVFGSRNYGRRAIHPGFCRECHCLLQ